MDDNKNYIDLAKKLKALAEKGVGGEKENAEEALNRLMKKHKISKEDLEDEKNDYHTFDVENQYRTLFRQVSSTVLGNKFDMWGVKRKKDKCVLFITTFQKIEIESKFEFYLRLYKREELVFYSAFVMKNNIYPKDGPSMSIQELSDEEKERIKRAMAMASGIKDEAYYKQIS